MIFTKDLLVKGMAAFAVCGSVAGTGYYYREDISNFFGGNSFDVTRLSSLGLPEGCKITEKPISCTDVEINSTNVGAINFVGKDANNQPQLSSGTAIVTVTKETSFSDFPYGYKISLKGNGADATITVGSTTFSLKQNEATEFKIKEEGRENDLKLEKAWTADFLAEKVGLTKQSDHWTVGEKDINVKHDTTDNVVNVTTAEQSNQGKIKVYEGQTNYNKGFKFVIQERDITLTSKNGNSITKLEEFETYEIKKDGETWKLIRKEKAFDEIKKALELPTENCNVSTESQETTCSLTVEKLKAIKFEGKGTEQITIEDNPTLNLKIKIPSTDEKSHYPLGYKFILESDKNITLDSTNSKHIKKDTNTEFKIKATSPSTGGARTLTLEKFWTPVSLGEKAGLTCNELNNANKECTLKENGINVHNGNDKKHTNLSRGDGNENKKIKYEVDVEGHNQGIKFYTEETNGITLRDGTGEDGKKIEHKGSNNSVSYEIKQESTTWYLFKKSATH